MTGSEKNTTDGYILGNLLKGKPLASLSACKLATMATYRDLMYIDRAVESISKFFQNHIGEVNTEPFSKVIEELRPLINNVAKQSEQMLSKLELYRCSIDDLLLSKVENVKIWMNSAALGRPEQQTR